MEECEGCLTSSTNTSLIPLYFPSGAAGREGGGEGGGEGGEGGGEGGRREGRRGGRRGGRREESRRQVGEGKKEQHDRRKKKRCM